MAEEDTPKAEENTAPAAETENKTAIENETAASVGSNRYLVKERFEIDFSSPISWLDSNGAKAYKTIDRIDPRRELFALICGNETAPRSTMLPYIKSIENNNMLKLVEYGVVSYIPQKSRNMALIYQTPLGGKVFDKGEIRIDVQNTEKFRSILISLLSVVESFKTYNLTHRAIRLDNLYFRNADKTEVVLGDCLASFPAFYQPSAYETVESMLCLKEGRGNGNEKSDIYAIGVTMLSLLLGHELRDDITNAELLRLKIKKGSYQTLLGEDRLSNQFAPIIRGLVNDIEDNRFNYVQAYNFLDGKSSNHNNLGSQERPKKSLTINGEKVYTARDVAIAMASAPQEAYELIKNGKIADWIKNGLENEKLLGKLEKMLAVNPENTVSIDSIIAKTCILIAPELPIKIRDVCLFPDGAPKAIFYATKNGGVLKDFYELFSADLIKLWYQEQTHLRSPANAAEFKVYINRNDIGYGIDRIMYDFDDDIPCTSPLLGNEFVNSPTRILRALDNTYAHQVVNTLPYDKSIIAYLRCKMGKKIDGIIIDLNTNKEDLQAGAVLRLYTNMQNKFGPAQLPNLTKWLSTASVPIIRSYHNIKYQKFLERELLKINKNGKLHELCDILENDEARKLDKSNYTKAVSEINLLLAEKSKLLNNSYKFEEEAKELAIKFASVLAVLIMLASFIFNLLYWALK